jgi:hypothetical protein
MLSDAQLDAIVHNLDQLGLKPAVRFRVIAALAPVLLGPEKLTAAEPVARPKKPARTRRKRTARPGSRRRSPRGRVVRKRPNGNGKNEPEPRPLSSDVPRPPTRDPDALALTYLKNELARGPIAASAFDDMVERGRLSVASVERAKEELGVVAVRLNRGRGAVVHLCLPDVGHEAEA